MPRCQGTCWSTPSASSPSSQPLLPCRWTFHTKQALRTLVHTRHSNFYNSVGSIDPSLALEGTSHCHTKKKKKKKKTQILLFCVFLTHPHRPLARSLTPSATQLVGFPPPSSIILRLVPSMSAPKAEFGRNHCGIDPVTPHADCRAGTYLQYLTSRAFGWKSTLFQTSHSDIPT